MKTMLLLLLMIATQAMEVESTFDREAMANHLRSEEGYSPKPYKCTQGFWTIGFGHRCEFDTPAINKEEANKLLMADIDKAYKEARKLLKGNHPESVEFVVVSMIFQLGPTGVSKFKKMLAKVNARDYKGASKEMLDSKWAKQTPNRAKRLAYTMEEAK
jgi:lysozyme